MNYTDSLLIGDFPCDFATVVNSMRQASTYGSLDPKWSELSKALGIRQEDITRLRRSLHQETRNLHEVVNEILEIWRAAVGDSATLKLLCNALRDCGLSDIADVLQNQFGRPTAASTAEESDIPSLPQNYIPRTLSLKTKVSPELFKTNSTDVFILSGMERHQVTLLANGKSTDTSENQRKRVTVRFIYLDFEEDVKDIFNVSSDPVHWIEGRSESYYWKCSSGSLELIQRFIENDEETRYTETEFIDSVFGKFNSTPVSIADTPGMGKSLLLSSIAHQVKTKFPQRHVGFLVLRDVMRDISEKQFPMKDVRKWMHSKISCCHHENCDKNIELFLDGYDEILSHQLSQAELLFKPLKTLGNLRFVVTTRPHMQNQLQAALGVLSCTILPFNMENQIQFLQQFWITNHQARDCDALTEFSSKLLNELKYKIIDKEREIAGVPLLCSLIAEVFSDDAARCSRVGNKRGVIIHVDSIFSIFERLMSKRLHENPRLEDSVSKHIKQDIFDNHVYEAFNLIFPEHKSVGPKKHAHVSPAQIYAVGLLENNALSSTPRFVHRTFAEFLVAEFFATHMTDHIVTIVLGTEMRRDERIHLSYCAFKHPVISYFINGQLDRIGQSFDFAKLSKAIKNQSYCAYNILAASTHANLPHCFDLVLKAAPGTRLTKGELGTLLVLAARHRSCKHLLDNILQLVTKHEYWKMFLKAIIKEPLQIAAEEGNYICAEAFINLLVSQNENLKPYYVLHYCMKDSLRAPAKLIEEKCEVVKLVCSLDRELVNQINLAGRTPLQRRYAHPKLLVCLLELGADPNVISIYKETVLHFSLYSSTGGLCTPKLFSELYDCLLAHDFTLFNQRDVHEETPLFSLVRHVEVEDHVLESFQSKEADFDARDKGGDSVLFHAIRGGRSAQFIDRLINRYGCTLGKNNKSDSALHMAAKSGNVEAAGYLVEANKCNINDQNEDGHTPLHVALMSGDNCEQIVKLLIDAGADVDVAIDMGVCPKSDPYFNWLQRQ